MQNHVEFKNTDAEFMMLFVEGGVFNMGSNNEIARQDEKPVHKVKLSSFWIGEFPVTQAVWTWVMQGIGREKPSVFNGDRHPVESVSWEDIMIEFLPTLNLMTDSSRPIGSYYRLPTEAEWEYAAKGGKYSATHDFLYTGSNKPDEVSWYSGNSYDSTQAVGLKTPNLLGLYDMSGNVYEWCSDWRSRDYTIHVMENPTGPDTGGERVYRGGSWLRNEWNCRCTYRGDHNPLDRLPHAGFRLVLS